MGVQWSGIVSSPDPSRAREGRKGLVTLVQDVVTQWMHLWAYCAIAWSPIVRILTAAEIVARTFSILILSSLISLAILTP